MSDRSYFHSDPAPEGMFTAKHVGWVRFGREYADGFALGFTPEKPLSRCPALYYTDDDLARDPGFLDYLMKHQDTILSFSSGIDLVEPFAADVYGLRFRISKKAMHKEVPGLYGHHASWKHPLPTIIIALPRAGEFLCEAGYFEGDRRLALFERSYCMK